MNEIALILVKNTENAMLDCNEEDALCKPILVGVVKVIS